MIAFVRGELIDTGADSVIVDVGGIGYEIMVSTSSLAMMPGIGETVGFHTYTYVREDNIGLFGFLTKDELSLFKQLIQVSGIGPKAALSILSVLAANELRLAILSEDIKLISSAPGIGPKTAKRLIVELKDKIDMDSLIEGSSVDAYGLGDNSADESDAVSSGIGRDELLAAREDAVLALTALGYGSSEAASAVRKADITPGMQVDDILKAALKKLV